MPDVPMFPACREFDQSVAFVPAHFVGALAGADVQSPSQCTTVDAAFGIQSAGPDSVVRIDGLVTGRAYIVQLASSADMSFYVVSGCSTPSGPSADECLAFVDASASGNEVGRFVARGSSAYVVVDYYQSGSAASMAFELDVYMEGCTSDTQCSAGLPVCSNGKCVECESSFDCTDPAAPRCDASTTSCIAGLDLCATDDASEPADDGPSGARSLALGGSGAASLTGSICSAVPSDVRTESDYYKFSVGSVGETWDVTLGWTASRLLRVTLYDAAGTELGRSYWEQPQRARLTYLAPGTYYIRVTDSSGETTSVGYTLGVQRTLGTGCTSRADCAGEFRNQIFRGECQAGSCVATNGAGLVPEGGHCDSRSDCATSLTCSSFLFVANADTRNVCARFCSYDSDCAPLGANYVCSTYFTVSNMCVQKCTSDLQCPTTTGSPPAGQPWGRLTCQLSTGRCL